MNSLLPVLLDTLTTQGHFPEVSRFCAYREILFLRKRPFDHDDVP